MKQFKYYFGVVDYVLFAALLFLSAMTGVYFACRHKLYKRKKEGLKDYLTGNKNLKPFPVAMSLIASYISGVTMLGTPAEIYNYGAQYWIIIFAQALSGITVAFVYMPVFRKLQVCSSYEYLELRFDKKLRSVASFLFLFDQIMFLPMLIYVPSLAFSQASEVNVHLIGIIACAICVFYTILGGLRAVVYTDTWQTLLMFFSDSVVIIAGIVAVGGIGTSIDKGIEGGRFQGPDFSPNMYERYSVWSVLIGGYVYWTSYNSVNQTMVQRYLSLRTDKDAKIAVGIFTFGVVFFISMCCYAGILLYATYYDCDPLTAGRIDKSDQLLPLFVVETAGHIKGIPGLFIAGVFGAGLSSLSVVLNSSSIVLLEDICTGMGGMRLTERVARRLSKLIVLILGVLACLMVLVVEQMRGVFEVATSLSSIVAGTMCGVYSLGMLVPWSNTKGAIAGAIAGMVMSCTVAWGSQYVASAGYIPDHKLPISVENCQAYGLNITAPPPPVYPDDSNIFPLFRIAYFWISPIGFFTVMIVGVITSFLTGRSDLKTMDPELISPISQWMLPAEAQNYAGTSVKNIESKRLLGTFEINASSRIRLYDTVASGSTEMS